MTSSNEQLSMWSHKPIVHVALSLKGGRFDPEDQPVKAMGDYKPGQKVTMIVEGYIDAKVTEDESEAGQVLYVSATIGRCYDVDEATAAQLLDAGHQAAIEALREKLSRPLESVAS